MDKDICAMCIERIRKMNPNCPAVKMCDSWKKLCGFPDEIIVQNFELCSACKDPAGELKECHCPKTCGNNNG